MKLKEIVFPTLFNMDVDDIIEFKMPSYNMHGWYTFAFGLKKTPKSLRSMLNLIENIKKLDEDFPIRFSLKEEDSHDFVKLEVICLSSEFHFDLNDYQIEFKPIELKEIK